MRLQRNSDEWFFALDAYFDERQYVPFSWGGQDCCTFAADWVLRATDNDPMADMRGLDTAIAARRALEDAGGMLAAVDARMGSHIPGPFAQAGDIAMITLDNGSNAMALCIGAFLAVPGDAGLQLVPIDRAEATWRV